MPETEDGKNFWVTEKKLRSLEPIYHNELEIFEWYKNGERGFKEEKYVIEGY